MCAFNDVPRVRIPLSPPDFISNPIANGVRDKALVKIEGIEPSVITVGFDKIGRIADFKRSAKGATARRPEGRAARMAASNPDLDTNLPPLQMGLGTAKRFLISFSID